MQTLIDTIKPKATGFKKVSYGFCAGFFAVGKALLERRREHTSVCDQLNEKSNAAKRKKDKQKRGYSSAGRAPALHAGGRRFDPA